MKIAKPLLTASFFLFSASLAAGRSSLDESAAEKQISGTLHQMYEAEKGRDLDFVLAHLADDFAEVAGDGAVYHRSDIQAGLADVALKDYKLSDCLFKLMTRDAAYMTCILDVDATYKGQPLPQRFRVTTVWTRHQGEWLVRFEQGTIIPEAKKSSPAKGDQVSPQPNATLETQAWAARTCGIAVAGTKLNERRGFHTVRRRELWQRRFGRWSTIRRA